MSTNKPITKLAVVDIETLDKTPSSIIFAIGCVIVDVNDLSIANEFYTVINPNQKGRTAGNGTPEWWLKQRVESPDAFEQLQSAYGVNKTLKTALYELGSFLSDEFNGEPVNMFGNGPEFDNVILDDAFAWAGLKTPWPYWGNQSIRTSNLFMQIAGVKSDREFVGIKHHALDDAYHEAFLLIDALKQFNSDVPATPKNPVHGHDDGFLLSLINEPEHLAAVIEEDIKKIHDNDLKNCMNGIFNTLRKNKIDVKTHKQCFEAVNSLIFENESLKQRASCFDELHIELAKANSDSFERECPSSLLDDCKHAINCLKTPAQNRSD